MVVPVTLNVYAEIRLSPERVNGLPSWLKSAGKKKKLKP
jgi:hypothetical protein